MAQVTGKINHFGLQMIQGRELRLRFVPSNGAVGNQIILADDWIVEVTPAPDGAFGVNLAATDHLRPRGTHYKIEALWFNPAIDGGDHPVVDELPFQLHVPAGGGEIGDLLRTPHDNTTVIVGDEPLAPVKGMWWVDESGNLWEWNGRMWIDKAQLEVMSASGTPREQYVGNNLATERILWPGPVYWVTTAVSGFPVHAVAGDTVWRVSTSQRERTMFDNFSRADGPAGSTPTGGLAWSTLPGSASAARPEIISQQLGIPGAEGATINSGVGLNFGADGYFRWNLGAHGAGRSTAFVFRWTDNQNLIAIAHRTSSSDYTARVMSFSGGQSTVLGSLGVPIEVSDQVEVQMRGPSLEISVNDVTRWTGEVTQNMSGTWCGATRGTSEGLFRLNAVTGGLVV